MAIKNAADTELPIPIGDGGTGQTTQQAALDAITNVASATQGQVLTKDGSGNAVFQSPLEGGEQLLFFTTTTSDATESTLGSVAVPADKAITFTIVISAKGPSNKHYWAKIDGGARRNTGENAALIGTPANTNDDENTPGYSATVDVSGNDLRIRVTGASAETVEWDAKILYSSDAAGEDLVASKSILNFSVQTTDATETTLGSIAIPDESNVSIWALVSAHKEDLASDKNYWASVEFAARRNNAGSAALVGTASIVEDDEGTPGYSVDVDVSGNNARLRVTGAGSETVSWSAKVIIVSDSLSEQLIDFLPVRDNDTYLQWRNFGDSADVDVLKLSSSDSVILYDFWEIKPTTGTLNGLNIGSGDNNTIAVPTTDGSDHARLVLAGGGSSSSSRGAAFYAHGNEHPSFPGDAYIQSGVGGDIVFNVGGTDRWAMTSNNLVAQGPGDIHTNTTDGSDNQFIRICGGGEISATRGASIELYGEEHANSSTLILRSGTSSGRGTEIWVSGTHTWSFTGSGGHLQPATSQIYDVGTSHTSRIRDLWGIRHHLTSNGQWAQYNVYTTNGSGSSPRLYIEPDSNSLTNTSVNVYIGSLSSGNLIVNGSVTKSSGAFVISHPDPAKNGTHKLKHCFVESPTEGDTLYRYTVTAANDLDVETITLPDYFQHLNKDVQVWVQAEGMFAHAYATVNPLLTDIDIHCEKAGTYSVLVIGTRKDPDAVDFFSTGVEYLNPTE